MNVIHPSAVIGPAVELGSDVTVGPNAVLLGPLTVGDRVWIGAGAQIGSPPEISSLVQHTAWTGDTEYAGVVLGNDVVVRENAVIHQGSHRATRVGAESWILNSAYLAHDVVVGTSTTVSASVQVGGHATIGDGANIGMGALVHQRRVIGAGAMVGMGTPVTRDVLPFAKAYGSPARIHGLNAYVLRKLGATETEIAALWQLYLAGNTPATPTQSIAAAFTWWNGLADLTVMAVDDSAAR